MKLDENVLKEELAKKNFDLIDVMLGKQNNTFEIHANKLHPVSVNQSAPIYMPITITLHVTLDSQSRIKKIEEDTSNLMTVAETDNFVKTLLDNKQIGGLEGLPQHNPTHQIELNNNGQQVIKRRNFSAF